MDEGKTRVKAAAPETIEHEVEDIRHNITTIVSELDRRRHEWVDWRIQLRKHAGILTVAAAGLLVVLGGTVGLGIWRRQKQRRPMARVRQWRAAVSRAASHPELVARASPSIGRKALAAAASGAAGVMAKTVTTRLLRSDRTELHENPR